MLAALLATRNEACSPGAWCAAAAAVLAQQDDVPLFAADLGPIRR